MTPSNPLRDESGSTHLDSTAQIMDRISSQLGTQLSLVSPDGTRRRASRRDPRPTLVLVAHGSRDPRALTTVTALAERVREQRPGLAVRLGHIELNEPLLTEVLHELTGHAVLVPLLLGRGQHVKRDIPAAAARFPDLGTRVAAPLGPHPLLAETLHARLVQAGWPERPAGAGSGAGARRGHAVVLAAAGSRDPESAADTETAAGLLADRLGVPVVPAYAAPTPACPRGVPEALAALAAEGRTRTAVASYFTAPGRFATQSAGAAPWIAAAPLGPHAALARLVLLRYDQARNAPAAVFRRTLSSV
ncbi:sirohydrochlorin chelatase [Streptomyces sp. Je 1-369]|uniref:sirohydrochlorin chelatase n=1 Tax=Streptomyces sp. Je 1-369 TaxID=2966192 RepID=UPI00228570BB|nr:sirohydrochlorin chelatase [Streptomyces sp. Je 1-369]WAL95356.1 sirohydrochlorin chelatase [Streptomyces sp. Je 1-369]